MSINRLRPPWLKTAGLVLLFFFGFAAAYYGIRFMSADSNAGNGSSIRDDPRSSYRGPFRNVHPDVKYVGREICARCHMEIAEDYARHPMSRTLSPISRVTAALPYDAQHN